MKKQSLRLVTGLLLTVLLISSCSKSDMNLDIKQGDFNKGKLKHGDVDLRHADFVYSGCRVRQTITRQFENSTLTRRFEYNKDNDPISVTSNSPGTSQPDLFFKYDKKGNLLEYYGLYWGGPSFEFLHRYGYSNNKIVADTMYIWGEYPNPTTYYSKRVRHIRYDNLDRVVADSEVYIYPTASTNVIRYDYDNNGNLVRSGASYDNKMSPQRTNRIWMFIDRNYSVNNMVSANNYTNTGLPLSLSGDPYVPVLNFAYFYYYKSAEIIYDCIDHGKKFPASPLD